MSQLYATGGQSFEASASVLPMNIQSWIPLGLTGWSSLLFKVLSRVFFSTTVWKHHFLNAQASLWSNSHISTGEKNSLLENVYWTYVYYMTTGKTITLTIFTFVGKVMSLVFFFFFFNTMPNYIIAFLLRSIFFLISWLQAPFMVILETKKIKSVTVSIFSPSIYHEVMVLDAI